MKKNLSSHKKQKAFLFPLPLAVMSQAQEVGITDTSVRGRNKHLNKYLNGTLTKFEYKKWKRRKQI